MGGGFYDNMWDPYSGAYAYPRTKPRAGYFRPRAPVYEQRPVYAEQRGVSHVQPESPVPSRVEEPSTRKTLRTIPVTDGDVPLVVTSQPAVPQRVEVMRPVRRFDSEDAAATKIQAVYRGHTVRKTEPLKDLRVIMKVREELEGFKRRLEEKEQRVKLCRDAQEKLRWTEGIMALLLRLDQLQGVHPEVRAIRKAVAKELIMLQERLDSMSDASEEVEDDANVEESEVRDAEEGAEVTGGDANIPAEEVVEEMEVEENVSNVEDVDVEESTEAAADDTTATPEHQDAMEQDVTHTEESCEHGRDSDAIKVADVSISEQHIPHEKVVNNPHNQGTFQLSDTIGESIVKDAEQDCLELPQADVPMVVGNEVSMVEKEVEVEADSPQFAPPVDVQSENEEPSGVDDSAGTAPSIDFVGEPMLEETLVERIDATKNLDQAHDVERDDTERLTNEVERPELDTLGSDGDGLHACRSPQRATDAGSLDASHRWMGPASPTSLQRQSSTKSLQAGQPQVSAAGDTGSLSDRALLEQLLEENRKLKECVGKVLNWAKQQNDVIHNLACRIEQLEEHQPQPNLLSDEKINSRKRISNDVSLAGERERSLRSKGRRKGKQGNKPQLGSGDSERLSAESDEYF